MHRSQITMFFQERKDGSSKESTTVEEQTLTLRKRVRHDGEASDLVRSLTVVGLALAVLIVGVHAHYLDLLLLIEGLAIALGPVVGGAIVSNVDWRWCFWVSMPVIGLACIFTIFPLNLPPPPPADVDVLVPTRKPTAKEKVQQADIFGGFLIIACLICLLLALQWGGERYEWNDVRIIILFIASGACFAYIVIHQMWKGEAAILPVKLCRSPHFTAYLIICIGMGAAFTTILYFMPTWFIMVKSLSPVATGVRMLSLTASSALVAMILARAAKAWSRIPPFAIVALALYAAGGPLLFTLDLDAPTWEPLVYLGLFGAGAGTFWRLAVLGAQYTGGPSDAGHAISSVTAFGALGGCLSIFACQRAFMDKLLHALDQPDDLVRDTQVRSFPDLLAQASPEQRERALATIYQNMKYISLVAVCLCVIPSMVLPFMRWSSFGWPPYKKTRGGAEPVDGMESGMLTASEVSTPSPSDLSSGSEYGIVARSEVTLWTEATAGSHTTAVSESEGTVGDGDERDFGSDGEFDEGSDWNFDEK
ncbi:unnamed protein product [Parascedosporium putredinis]|uniref:Major facilitator superfamily transporter n=1 Tax=Parascedosporium putredinis TaxID=1442378 RepID=A0A9P1MBM5_9PEZI|nr:unnamed protein product [Parascedosporium putredinis]CAI7998946.1 unnamed protein product [Parascedosporium putredinis]